MRHAEEGKIGVLLAQIGTPDSHTKKALHTYLRKFLSDPRVIDLHPLLWKPILHGLVLRTRPSRSAKLYREIWTEKGSPLLVLSQQVAAGIQERLGNGYIVELGTAYGDPSIPDAIARLETQHIQRLVVLPLFPQFSTATTASIFDEAYAAVSGRSWGRRLIRKKYIPSLDFKSSYHTDPGYLHALTQHIQKFVRSLERTPDRYIITFHGLPKRFITEGDPYLDQCTEMAKHVANELGWRADEWMMTFQSRFGAERWLGPQTYQVLKKLPAQGCQRPCVIPLSFTTDCLETLHELGIVGKGIFEKNGGDPSHYALAPCLNDSPEWLDVLTEMIRR